MDQGSVRHPGLVLINDGFRGAVIIALAWRGGVGVNTTARTILAFSFCKLTDVMGWPSIPDTNSALVRHTQCLWAVAAAQVLFLATPDGPGPPSFEAFYTRASRRGDEVEVEPATISSRAAKSTRCDDMFWKVCAMFHEVSNTRRWAAWFRGVSGVFRIVGFASPQSTALATNTR